MEVLAHGLVLKLSTAILMRFSSKMSLDVSVLMDVFFADVLGLMEGKLSDLEFCRK